MRKIYIILLASVAALGLAACTNLDEKPYDMLTSANIDWSEEETLTRFAGNVYNNIRYMYWGYYGMFNITEDCSDLHMIPARIGVGWGAFFIPMHKHEYAQTNVEEGATNWNYAYDAINYANQALDNENFAANKEAAAKIRFLRAFAYYVLFDHFRNIPVLKTFNLPEGFQPEQEKPEDTFNWIESELLDILEDLGREKTYGIPNEFAARMTLAKMYLNHNAWFVDPTNGNYTDDKEWYKKAIDQVKVVIDEGGYSLAAKYKDNFLHDLSANNEIIFAVPLDAKNASHNYLVCQELYNGGGPAFGFTSQAWNGGAAIPQFIDTYKQDLGSDGKPKKDADGEVIYLDKRFYDTWAYGQQYDMKTGEKLTSGTGDIDSQGSDIPIYYTKEVHSIDNPGAYMLQGYRCIKYEICEGTDGTWGDDVPVFRLSDAYFIAAECALRLNGGYVYSEAQAAQFVTDVRMRSFDNPADATRTVEDLKGGSVYDYGIREYTKVAPENPNFKYEEVWNSSDFRKTDDFQGTYDTDIEFGGLLDDLAWEFMGEFHRRQDLIRFRCNGGKQNVFDGRAWFCKEKVEDPTDVHLDIFPLWDDVLKSNIKLKQNPGYSASADAATEE